MAVRPASELQHHVVWILVPQTLDERPPPVRHAHPVDFRHAVAALQTLPPNRVVGRETVYVYTIPVVAKAKIRQIVGLRVQDLPDGFRGQELVAGGGTIMDGAMQGYASGRTDTSVGRLIGDCTIGGRKPGSVAQHRIRRNEARLD